MGCIQSPSPRGPKPTNLNICICGTGADGNAGSNSLASDQHCVVELVEARNVPDMDVGDASDPFAVISLLGESGARRPGTFALRWPFRKNCNDPIWRVAKDFNVNAEDSDSLRIELFDYDTSVSPNLCLPGAHLLHVAQHTALTSQYAHVVS